jgi:hypothetical protein
MPGPSKWFFSSGFLNKTLYTPLLSPIPTICPAHLIFFRFNYPNNIVWAVHVSRNTAKMIGPNSYVYYNFFLLRRKTDNWKWLIVSLIFTFLFRLVERDFYRLVRREKVGRNCASALSNGVLWKAGWRESDVEFGIKLRGLFRQWRDCLEIKANIIFECNFVPSCLMCRLKLGFCQNGCCW